MTKQSDLTLKDTGAAAGKGPVTCLGMTFESDEERRAWFTEELRKKLQDPEFRAIEGFPIGEDEDILAMSDPPYYTACPNPWLEDFVKQYGEDYDPNTPYRREPLAIDVSVGKTDAIYRAHSYHTKVPHLAIVPSILHYTKPGDVVLDGFAGSGMTGVAAQWCGTAPEKYRQELEQAWKQAERTAPEWGARHVVLNDLSPAATFIAANYNIPFDVNEFAKAGKNLLEELEQEIGWMYETLHTDGKTKARIDYTVWSEVFSCPECSGEINFLNEALDEKTKRIRKQFDCPHCSTQLTRKKLEHRFVSHWDDATRKTVSKTKRQPMLIAYRIGKTKYEKKPDSRDLALLSEIESRSIPEAVPAIAFPYADMWEAPRMRLKGVTHTHHLFLPRAAQAMGVLWNKAQAYPEPRVRAFLLFMVEQAIWGSSLLNRYRLRAYSNVNQYLAGVFYIASQTSECSPWYILNGKLRRLVSAFRKYQPFRENAITTTGTATTLMLDDASIDYIFTDPPFGENIPYAELNLLVESWHKVITAAEADAIVDRAKENRAAQKSIEDYRRLMAECFAEYYRVLKPGRWMTVVFSNTKSSVWNAIQTAIQEAGFVVANVSALDKQQGSFKAVTTSVAVRQDLVISAYKPNGGFEERFLKEAQTEEGVWGFVRTHLSYLPVTKLQDGKMQHIPERDPRILFDQVVAYYVRKGYAVPLSSQEFQAGLPQRFVERDGMYFLPEQIAEYDRNKMISGELGQASLFVSDEASAIQWLRQLLHQKPQTFAELNPQFMQQLSGWSRNEQQLDLRELLEQNFLLYNGKGPVPGQIHAYLSSNWKNLRNRPKDDPELREKAKDRWYVPDPNKAGDLEMLRERALLREFEQYKTATKRLRVFRLEAVRAGFKKAWQDREYETIIEVAEKIPPKVLEEDPKLLMWYDQAVTRIGSV